ncbi:ADP-ribose pyrophosphatase [Hypnocyclicus thermotrophus]|uniref:ADP-ribose pyrophosphatase n=1 Tax=Hypnocyclicus thermotrophus TaxID=1627895 RepID=A0AA46DZD1_9FUSO|nr:NUDIX hydrolase [Hypnocyclicus thermotrophus]TDT71377.1 ADP-ribose pyrophosphatase [Hypnocyclicus thermotrophus]
MENKFPFKFLKFKLMNHPTTNHPLEYIEKHKAVCALLLNNNESKTLLVNQFRPGANNNIYEIPAGLIDPGEEADTAVYREILEETGYEKESLELLYKSNTPLLVSPGYTTESLYFYIFKLNKENITPKPLSLDESEDLITSWHKLDNDFFANKTDLKSYFAYLLYLSLKNKEL